MSRAPAARAYKAPEKEIGIHMTVAAFLRRAWPEHLVWFHVPNGEKRDKVTRTRRDGSTVTYSPQGAKLKAMGALAGVPDFVFLLPNGQAAFIELKKASGGLSDAQIDFREAVLGLHCGYVTARSLDEVERALAGWLALFNLKLRATTGARQS